MKEFYFNQFDHRKPYKPVKDNIYRARLFQVAGILAIIAGLIYLYWRWAFSLNFDALWFSLPLAIAETFSFLGICFFIFDLWQNKDAAQQPAPHYLSEVEELNGREDRPIKIDVFIATLNEEAELLRYTIKDAKAMEYPFDDMPVHIFVLDDGRRDGRNIHKENIKKLCQEEGVKYISREHNTGYKAGNLKNGIEHTSGDFFVILDADNRPFPGFLKNTLGYFKREKVAWVQTCHWFYDTTETIPLSTYLINALGITSEKLKKAIIFSTGYINTGGDIFGSEPRQFYEVIQRRRNFHNASFCCGAASVHRREAVMGNSIKLFSESFNEGFLQGKMQKDNQNLMAKRMELIQSKELMPFMFHASEDLYSSMVIHSDSKNKWESVLHPYVESKLLSPQDMQTFVKQRLRYAEGSIDIALHDNPLFKKGLSWRQKLCYFHTAWAYFSCIWILIFLLSPIVFFFTHQLPVDCSSTEFFAVFIPFYFIYKIAETAGSWGISQKRGRQYYICLFWINLQAIISVLSGKKVKFTVTPKYKQQSHPLKHSWPHLTIIILTVSGIILNGILVFFGSENLSFGITMNTLWGLHNCYTLSVYVRAAYWDTELSGVKEKVKEIERKSYRPLAVEA
ncbi:MAG: glycosyltransferase [Bacteroidetes bacterium]|nr:glycosyltransferase [Bacteroidota bacterium]HET6245061.1 glycosyltransferase [Bacteroidia bacterium]